MKGKTAMEKVNVDRRKSLNTFLMGNKSIIILLLLIVIMTFASEVFMTQKNISNVMRQICVSAVMGFGYTIIIGSGHIDLSVGTMMGFIGILVAKMMVGGVPMIIAILLGCIIGCICGALNATLITIFALPPFIVTLATRSLYEGTGYLITKMVPVSQLPDKFINLGQGYLFYIPIPVYVMAITLIAMTILASRTKLGRHAIAMGGNPEAARVSGINIGWTRTKVYMTAGLCVGIAAALLTARSASAQVAAGQGMEMDSIAAVVIGGTPMGGGKATVIGTLVGCMIVGVVKNGLNLLGVNSNWQVIAKGMMILLAIVLDVISVRVYTSRGKRQSKL